MPRRLPSGMTRFTADAWLQLAFEQDKPERS
jgi:hypothetical protein